MVMKKYILSLVVFTLSLSLQAGVLRVNNYDGSAPYSNVEDAINAAAEGDTIMLDGSYYSYGDVTLDKRVVLMGNGYYLIENGIATESITDAIVDKITINAEGTVIKSLRVSSDVTGGWIKIFAPKVIIQRCYIGNNDSGVVLYSGADNCIIHQCYVRGPIGNGNSYNATFNHQITNNMLPRLNIRSVQNSYIAYNTSWSGYGEVVYSCMGNKIEKNHVYNENFGDGDSYNAYVDNFTTGALFKDAQTVADFKNTELPEGAKGKGCFAGDDPFVISGVPAGPMIEKLDVPTSAEAGGTMKVSVKIGEAK